MTSPGSALQVGRVSRAEGVAAGATIWARATQARDGRPVTSAEVTADVQRRLDLPGAEVLVARRAGQPVGFALVAPHDDALELFYLGVDPDAWGSGVADQLLCGVEEHARAVGRGTLELWVLDDNARAITRYERSGWSRTVDVQQDPRGRLERRFVRRVPAAPDKP